MNHLFLHGAVARAVWDHFCRIFGLLPVRPTGVDSLVPLSLQSFGITCVGSCSPIGSLDHLEKQKLSKVPNGFFHSGSGDFSDRGVFGIDG